MQYDLLTPPRILFGWGRRRELGEQTTRLASRVLLVSGSRTLDRSGLLRELTDDLGAQGVAVEHLAHIAREPETSDVDAAARTARERLHGGDASRTAILAVGGGAALDLAKAVAGLATQNVDAPVIDYLEGVGRGRKLTAPPLPWIAVPTTAGTGSEATKNAVLSSQDPPFKKSFRDDRLLARLVVVDPELTVSCPRATTVESGLDAITQLVESYVTRRRHPLVRALVEQALPPALDALPRAASDGRDRAAREAMAHAALVSGICLANAGLGLAHGVAAALGAHAAVAHGRACAALLPTAVEVNLAVCAPDFARLARLCRLDDGPADARDDLAAARQFQAHLAGLVERLGVPTRLRQLGVAREQVPALVDSSRGNSRDGNPVALSDAELETLLEQRW